MLAWNVIFLCTVCIAKTLAFNNNNHNNVLCPSGSTACPTTSRCIPSVYFCDGDDDCGDASDEPDTCPYRTCEPDHVRCRSGQCINRHHFCSGLLTCADSSVYIDDGVCPIVWCPPGQSKCRHSNKCIRDSWFCDGDNDCDDWSDESSAVCRDRPCPDWKVKCNSGLCIDKEPFCTGLTQCDDDTTVAEICPDVECEPGWLKCATVNSCIRADWICDGVSDCNDNSDETVCGEARSSKRLLHVLKSNN